jgi:hypothetical protein
MSSIGHCLKRIAEACSRAVELGDGAGYPRAVPYVNVIDLEDFVERLRFHDAA